MLSIRAYQVQIPADTLTTLTERLRFPPSILSNSTQYPEQYCYFRFEVFYYGDYEECRLMGCYAVWLLLTGVSENHSASITRVTRIGELGTTSN
jgi:hypothetical protein